MKKGSSNRGGPLCHCVTSPHTVGSHPQTPFLKLSVIFLSHIPTLDEDFRKMKINFKVGIWLRKIVKSLWKGVWGRTFPQKGLPQ